MSGEISIRSLCVEYAIDGKIVKAVNDVSLDLPAGHRTALVGESGSGKSSLGLALLGLLPKNATASVDSFSVDGVSVDFADPLAVKLLRGRQIAMVFQDAKASLDPVRTIHSQIAEVLKVHKIVCSKLIDEEVRSALKRVEIQRADEVRRQYPHELSGGMRQRAMIATALAGRPGLLIADEPTSALDVTTQATVIALLRGLSDSGTMSTLLITHDLALVASFAQTVIVMYAGNIVEIGSVDDIYRNPGHPYTRALLDSIPNLTADRRRTLSSIAGSLPDLTQEIVGCSFEPRCPYGMGNDKCAKTAPKAITLKSGSRVSCHFAEEISEGTASYSALWSVNKSHDSLNDNEVEVEFNRIHDPQTVLDVSTLFKTFHGKLHARSGRSKVVAVGGVDLVLREGESVGIVGESGSGKTTLGRVIVGLERKDSGSVRFRTGSRDLSESGLPKGYAQFIFQDPGDSLNPLMTIEEIISEPLVLRDGGTARSYHEEVANLLADVGLQPSMAKRPPSRMSGGQRQRVAIARALSTSPKLIIADEAVASLDMSARGQILNLLSRLQRKGGFAYIFISHDLSMVRHVCDRVVVMYRGRIVETGSVDEIFSKPEHPYTQALISAVPVPDPEVERARVRIFVTDEPTPDISNSGGCSYRFYCRFAKDICTTTEPIIDQSDEHGTACHFKSETAASFIS